MLSYTGGGKFLFCFFDYFRAFQGDLWRIRFSEKKRVPKMLLLSSELSLSSRCVITAVSEPRLRSAQFSTFPRHIQPGDQFLILVHSSKVS